MNLEHLNSVNPSWSEDIVNKEALPDNLSYAKVAGKTKWIPNNIYELLDEEII